MSRVVCIKCGMEIAEEDCFNRMCRRCVCIQDKQDDLKSGATLSKHRMRFILDFVEKEKDKETYLMLIRGEFKSERKGYFQYCALYPPTARAILTEDEIVTECKHIMETTDNHNIHDVAKELVKGE